MEINSHLVDSTIINGTRAVENPNHPFDSIIENIDHDDDVNDDDVDGDGGDGGPRGIVIGSWACVGQV